MLKFPMGCAYAVADSSRNKTVNFRIVDLITKHYGGIRTTGWKKM